MNIQQENLSVTIKVLKVNSSKMTLSVFKQLPTKDIIDENFNLQGKVWGIVNYHLSNQPKYEKNIIWQNGNNLYRCAVRPLTFSPEQAKRNQDNPAVSLYKELPHHKLFKAVEETPYENIKSISELFEKYREAYKTLINSDQLFIAT